MAKRREYNKDTYCGCKVCDREDYLQLHIYCDSCERWLRREKRNAAVDMAQHQRSIYCREHTEIRQMKAQGYTVMCNMHKYGATPERMRELGFPAYGAAQDQYYGPRKNAHLEKILLASHNLDSGRRELVLAIILRNEDAWNAASVMAEPHGTHQDTADMWMDFYLQCKRGAFE